jgi:hypothetical protein
MTAATRPKKGILILAIVYGCAETELRDMN